MTQEFNVHAVGPSGAGKTVFLASLYRALNLRRHGSAFFLATDATTSAQLNSIYMQVADPESHWPEATSELREWVFTACVGTPNGNHEPLRFHYIDYPGGVLTNPRALESETGKTIGSRLRSADALLILLDGQSLLALMRGEPAGDRFLDFELTATLEIVQQTRCPIHFVVTKWDLLQEAEFDLAQIRRRLEEDENFSDCVAARVEDASSPIRLIPVSSIGRGYATTGPDGQMLKVPGARPKPSNVELPLFAVFPDFVQQAYVAEGAEALSQIAERELAAAHSGTATRSLTQRWKIVRLKVASFFNLSPAGIKVVGYIDALWQGNQGILRRDSVKDETDALALVVAEFNARLADFERAEPCSSISPPAPDFENGLLRARAQIAERAGKGTDVGAG